LNTPQVNTENQAEKLAEKTRRALKNRHVNELSSEDVHGM